MGGIVMLNLQISIMEEVNTRLQEMENQSKTDFLSSLLHDILVYLNEEELNEVKKWVADITK